MTVTCPEGHQSEATDYCDICGTPIGGPSGSSAAAGGAGPGGAPGSSTPGPAIPQAGPGSVLDLDPAAAPAATLTCPHCGALNVADALFCEACGYDFTTGAAPLGSEPVVPDQDDSAAPGALDLGVDAGQEADGAEHQDDVAAGQDEARGDDAAAGPQDLESQPASQDAEGDAGPDDAGDGAAPADTEEDVAPEDAGDDAASGDTDSGSAPEPEPGQAPEVAPATSPGEPSGAVAAHARPRHTPPSRTLSDTWVVEVWIDPDWYAVQQTEEACPSPGLPDIVVVRRNVALVGRPSGSLGVRPDVDAGADSAVSRRHAQLTSDGSRWWIEDLGSSNGTYVGAVGEPLPTEPIRQRVEIDRDDRIYVGAWTRLVLRQATASEQAGQG